MSFATDYVALKNSVNAYALLIKNKFILMIPSSEKGALNGVAPLVNGTVPSQYLPSYVDDVLEYNGVASFPAIGETSKIYVDTSSIYLPAYRWTGSGLNNSNIPLTPNTHPKSQVPPTKAASPPSTYLSPAEA